MGMDLVFQKIIDGSRLERIESFPINFIRDYYPKLCQILSEYSTMHTPKTSEVWICPSTNFMSVYNAFEEFCKDKNNESLLTLKTRLISAIEDDLDINDIKNILSDYEDKKESTMIEDSYIERIKKIMRILKDNHNTSCYYYLSY